MARRGTNRFEHGVSLQEEGLTDLDTWFHSIIESTSKKEPMDFDIKCSSSNSVLHQMAYKQCPSLSNNSKIPTTHNLLFVAIKTSIITKRQKGKYGKTGSDGS